jgi:hypothetical protein
VIGNGLDQFFDDIIVPAGGGPYVVEDILATPLVPIPGATPSNEIDSAVLTTASAALAVNLVGTATPVPGLVVTVPDLERPVYLAADLPAFHQTVATAKLAALIAPVGSTAVTQSAGTWGEFFAGVAGATGQVTLHAFARLPAGSPGDYQVFVAGTSGNMIVNGAVHDPAQLTELAV